MDLSLHVIYLTILLICSYCARFAERGRTSRRRAQWAEADREEYYRKLGEQFNKMDQIRQDEENDIIRRLNELKEEGDKLKEELKKVSNKYGIVCKPASSDYDDEEEALRQELSDLRERSNNLQRLDREINETCKKIFNSSFDEATDRNDMLRKLCDKIVQLETENSLLSDQITKNDCALPNVGRNYDAELLQYLDGHDDDLSLDYLKKAYTTLLDIKASKPDLDFEKYTKEIIEQPPNYVAELTKLQVVKRQFEMKLEARRKEYSKEISSFSETRLEYILKNSGAQEELDSLKDRNKTNQDYIEMLQEKLETREAEVLKLQEMFLKTQEESRKHEKETNDRYQAWKDTELRREKYDSQLMLNRAQEISAYQHSYVMNSSSSVLGSLIPPPPPPIEIPPLEEILGTVGTNNSQESLSFPYSIPEFPSNMPVPPPPPVDLTYEENLGHRSSASSIATSRHRNYA